MISTETVAFRVRLGALLAKLIISSAATVFALFAATAVASASTFCVHDSACPAGGVTESTLPDAVQAAKASHDAGQRRNRIAIGEGVVPYAGEADDFSGNPIDVAGAGRGRTILDVTASGGAAQRALGLIDPTSTVSDLTIRLVSPPGPPAVFSLGGLLLRDGARAERVDIDGTQSGPSSVGLDIRGSSIFEDGTITMPKPTGARGVSFVEGGGNSAVQALSGSNPRAISTITRTTVTGVTGLYVTSDGAARASRVRITANGAGALTDGGELDLYDSLIQTASVSSLPPSQPPSDPASALVAVSTGSGATLRADNVTLVGDGTGFGMLAGGSPGAGPGRLFARNVVASRFDTALLADASLPGTRLDVDYSAFSTAHLAKNSAFALGRHNLTVTKPGFADAAHANFTPAVCSPLVDRGSPAALNAAEPNVDLAGLPRVVAGEAGARPRRDIGALEYQRRGGGGCFGDVRVGISPKQVRVVRSIAPIRLRCPRAARVHCAGTLTLSTRVLKRVRGPHGTVTRTVTVVVGRARYDISRGMSALVRVHLTRNAHSLISHTPHRRLDIGAAAVQRGSTVTSSADLVLLLAGSSGHPAAASALRQDAPAAPARPQRAPAAASRAGSATLPVAPTRAGGVATTA